MAVDVQRLFREYVFLDRKRTSEGITPEEYVRWQQLRSELDQRFHKGPRKPAGAEQRQSVRIPTKLNVDFESQKGLAKAVMTNLSRGGLFITTQFPLPAGTRLDLRARITKTGEMIEIPCEVVSVNVGGGFATGSSGMGVRFLELSDQLRSKVDDLYAELALMAAEQAAKEEGR